MTILLANARTGGAVTLPLSVPFEYQSQIYVRVAVNHSRAMLFVLDSGASACVLDTATARRLNIQSGRHRSGSGAGKGAVSIGVAKDVTYEISGTSLKVPESYVIDLSGQRTLQGRDVGGILGYDFFAHYVVRLDFEASVMTLEDPDTYVAPPRSVSVPLTMIKHTPHMTVRVKVDGRNPADRQVLVDTGSADAVDVDDLARAPTKLDIIGGVGLGQEFRTTIGRAEWAEVGGARLPGPLGATGGVQLVGLEVLRRFNLAFDYPHSRLFLVANRDAAAPFEFDASGLDLRWTADLTRFVIHDVASHSAAEKADLRAGDEVVTINNQAARAFRIDRVGQMLSEDGERIQLGILSHGNRRTVTLKLRKRL